MPSLLIVDDDPSVLHVFRRVFDETDITLLTAESGAAAVEIVERELPDVVVLDIMLPDESGLDIFKRIHNLDSRIPVILITASGTSDTAIEAMKLGAFDYLTKPLDFRQMRELVAQALEIRRFTNVPVALPSSNGSSSAFSDALVGRCAAIQEVYKSIGRVAPQNVTVLIRGESGTGKELVARAIYQHSERASGKFLAVNCAAIPETLLESELFGHEKGSFTGADSKRIGKFEQCSGGTLFLDEVGDMTPLVQSKLLRVLQEQRFERVGGNETVHTDVRIITATNRDLDEMVSHGQFRPDLYYRLNGFTIKLPPLRERVEDIVVLLEHFLHQFNRELGKNVSDISQDALELLMRYRWPGNVRELQSVLKQALLHATGSILMADFLPGEIRGDQRGVTGDRPQRRERSASLEGFVEEQLRRGSDDLYNDAKLFMERLVITRVLRHTSGNQSHAAKILGITRGSLRNKIRQLHITIDQVVSVDGDQPRHEPMELSSV